MLSYVSAKNLLNRSNYKFMEIIIKARFSQLQLLSEIWMYLLIAIFCSSIAKRKSWSYRYCIRCIINFIVSELYMQVWLWTQVLLIMSCPKKSYSSLVQQLFIIFKHSGYYMYRLALHEKKKKDPAFCSHGVLTCFPWFRDFSFFIRIPDEHLSDFLKTALQNVDIVRFYICHL
jgi:hypothetical protein